MAEAIDTEATDTAALADGEIEEKAAAPPKPPEPPELLQWYQFRGNLYDSAATENKDQQLIPATEQDPQWKATGQSYGLAVGTDEVYSLPSVNFFRHEQDQGGGIFLFHIRPISEGTSLKKQGMPLLSVSPECYHPDQQEYLW